jgi:uncharacterized protein DUF2568
MRAANLALKFLLELAAFAALAYWGATVNIALAILAPAVAIVLWALFAAPRSERRLPTATRVPFELAVFGAAAVALVAADQPVAAIVFAVLAVVNAVLLFAFDQLEA